MSIADFPETIDDVFDITAAHVSPGKPKHFRNMGFDFAFGRREGIRVWNIDGARDYINCHVNGGTYNLGHRHPRLISALTLGLQEVDIGNHHLPSHLRGRLAKKLAATSPGQAHQYSVFGASGGEAMDVALKVARRHTGRRTFIAATTAYHGHTGLALGIGSERYIDYFNCGAPDTIRVPFNDIDALRAVLTEDVAAVVLETIPATGGIETPLPGYLAEVAKACRDVGALYVADEVQTGLGRMGSFWGIEQLGVEADMIVSAKGLGGGVYPLTATLMTQELIHVFDEDPFAHVSTCGGAEIGCLVGEAVVDITAAPGFLENVRERAKQIRDGLSVIADTHGDVVAEIRGVGLFLGIRFRHPEGGVHGMKAALDAGLLCWRAGNMRSVLQFLPPLIITEDDAVEILARTETLVRLWRERVEPMDIAS